MRKEEREAMKLKLMKQLGLSEEQTLVFIDEVERDTVHHQDGIDSTEEPSAQHEQKNS